MTKRVTVVAAISLFAVLAVPSVAFAQDEQGSSGEPPVTGGTAGTEQEPQSTPPEPEPVTPDPPVVSEQTEQEETSGTTEEPETDVIEPQVASSDSGSTVDTSSADTSTQVASSSQATVTGTNKISSKKSSKKSSKNRKGKKKKAKGSCATSSRGGGPLASASAPPPPGCTRLDAANGVLVAPDGTTLTITETSQGVINVTVSNAPGGAYSGTLFVKGGPQSPGEPCVFNAVPNGASQSCTTPVNPNSGQFFGVSHVDACLAGVTPDTPGTPGTPGDTDRGGGQRREEEQERERERRRRAAREAVSAPVAAATAVAAPGGQLPVTGLPVAWLLLVGGGLLVSGFAIRRMA